MEEEEEISLNEAEMYTLPGSKTFTKWDGLFIFISIGMFIFDTGTDIWVAAVNYITLTKIIGLHSIWH